MKMNTDTAPLPPGVPPEELKPPFEARYTVEDFSWSEMSERRLWELRRRWLAGFALGALCVALGFAAGTLRW